MYEGNYECVKKYLNKVNYIVDSDSFKKISFEDKQPFELIGFIELKDSKEKELLPILNGLEHFCNPTLKSTTEHVKGNWFEVGVEVDRLVKENEKNQIGRAHV